MIIIIEKVTWQWRCIPCGPLVALALTFSPGGAAQGKMPADPPPEDSRTVHDDRDTRRPTGVNDSQSSTTDTADEADPIEEIVVHGRAQQYLPRQVDQDRYQD